MRFGATTAVLIALVGCQSVPTRTDETLPRVADARAASGYSIGLTSIDPAPGTPLVRGTEVVITASVTYTLTVANHGVVVLVPEDEKYSLVATGAKQVSRGVSAPSGTLILKQTMTIPLNTKEIRLYIPLVPDGIRHTSGAIAVRYPVVDK